MSLDSDFATVIGGYAALTSLVPADRIQPSHAASGIEAPYVTWSRVFSGPENSLDGFTSGLEKVRLQVDSYAADFDTAIAIAAQVRAAVNAETGAHNLRGVCINEMDFFEDDTRLFRRMLEFSLFHRS